MGSASNSAAGGPAAAAAAAAAADEQPRFVFFTDFDGTITQQDTNDYMTDHLGFGPELRKKGNADVLHGRRHFRDSFREMLDSIETTSLADCIALVKQHIAIDPHFEAFFAWADAAGVPIVVLSGGMEPVIRALLEHWLGAEAVRRRLRIVANGVAARPGKDLYRDPGGWQIVYHDDSPFGHDKSTEIRKVTGGRRTSPGGGAAAPAAAATATATAAATATTPVVFYAGDGVSDLSAAHEADLMFAKAGRDLVSFCRREQVPYTEFRDFGDIARIVADVVEGRTTVAAVVGQSSA